jgi:mono/diheme cytochrome c family protein
MMSAYSVDPHEYSGVRLYQVYCSSCHGLTGHGDGPVEPLLKHGVPDLTKLSQRNGGKFPAERVRQMIDGRSMPSAHGAREMPVWGFEFYGSNAPNEQLARKQADDTIHRLVDYLRTIQPNYDR